MKLFNPSMLFGTLLLAASPFVGELNARNTLPYSETSVFTSTDKTLENSYRWAKEKALSFAHDNNDPVGPWYEAALPNREAFCMRDVSHQSVGAQILGLERHNKNIFTKFVENISDKRDYCSFWEINRYNLPAPADYASDTEFWYNLNANFDVMQACLKMYDWTGDKDYLTDPRFSGFYKTSVNEYVDRWQLQPDRIMDREPIMNKPADFNPKKNFHVCRGLPSYVENFPGLAVGVDLVGTLYAGFDAYSKISTLRGDMASARKAASKVSAYRNLLEKRWWDAANSRYHTFWTHDRKFRRGEGVPLLLWFNAPADPARIRASVEDIMKSEWNVENQSAFPAMFYRLGYHDLAYKFIKDLPSNPRADYPEVSYGLVEGVVCGAMGVKPSASDNTIETLSRVPGQKCKIKNLPMLGGYVSLLHDGSKSSEIENNTDRDLIWKVSFLGKHKGVKVDGKRYPVKVSKDINGNVISTAEVKLPSLAVLYAEAV